MFSFKSFCDLSVTATDPNTLFNMCQRYVELGYKVIAVNQIMEEATTSESNPISRKRKKPGANATRSEPNIPSVPEPIDVLMLRKRFAGKLKILSRLTFSFDDDNVAHAIINNKNTREYDILAAIPKTVDAMKHVCDTLKVDIITFNPEDGIEVPKGFNGKVYNMAVKCGKVFELPYAPAIFSPICRQTIIAKAHSYYLYGKLKNVIISSNAGIPLYIKGPYEIINFALILGFSEESSKFAITENVKKILKQAVCRKLGQTSPVLLVDLSQAPSGECEEDSMTEKECEKENMEEAECEKENTEEAEYDGIGCEEENIEEAEYDGIGCEEENMEEAELDGIGCEEENIEQAESDGVIKKILLES